MVAITSYLNPEHLLFQQISSCPGFPVSHYFLILGDDLSNQSQVLLGPSMRADFSLNSSHLKKDWQYNYRVKAVNNINISSETERKQFCESYFNRDLEQQDISQTSVTTCLGHN